MKKINRVLAVIGIGVVLCGWVRADVPSEPLEGGQWVPMSQGGGGFILSREPMERCMPADIFWV